MRVGGVVMPATGVCVAGPAGSTLVTPEVLPTKTALSRPVGQAAPGSGVAVACAARAGAARRLRGGRRRAGPERGGPLWAWRSPDRARRRRDRRQLRRRLLSVRARRRRAGRFRRPAPLGEEIGAGRDRDDQD